jgi:hypothetical protein
MRREPLVAREGELAPRSGAAVATPSAGHSPSKPRTNGEERPRHGRETSLQVKLRSWGDWARAGQRDRPSVDQAHAGPEATVLPPHPYGATKDQSAVAVPRVPDTVTVPDTITPRVGIADSRSVASNFAPVGSLASDWSTGKSCEGSVTPA